MADLTEIQSAQPVKLIGSDGTGKETTPVQSTGDGKIKAADVLDGGGANGAITVGTSAVEVMVGASRLTNRKQIIIQPKTNGIFLGFSNAVTIANGIELFKDQTVTLPIGPNTGVWLISGSAGNNVRIAEVS